MTGDFIAYYLNTQEYKSVLTTNKRYEATYSPYIVIDILHHLSEESFEGMIAFAEYQTQKVYITRQNERTYTITQEYHAKKAGVFTFDGIRFFRILNYVVRRNDGMLIFNFQFLKKSYFSEANTAFMVMPFNNDELDAFYKKHIKEYLASSHPAIEVYRADNFTGNDVIADTIIEQIRKSEFIICDISACNKNVFFEIGYARGINKDIIFLLNEVSPAEFFDINHIRRIQYSYNRPQEFSEVLKASIQSIREHRRN